MKKRVLKNAIYGLLLYAVAMSQYGCKLYEDYSECPTGLFITVKAYATAGDGQELDETTISEVALFVFDEKEKYLGKIDTRLNVPTQLNFPGYRKFHVVAFGNSQSGGHEVLPGSGLNASVLNLKSLTRAAVLCKSPNDLFFAKASLEGKPKIKQDVRLDMYRKVAQMNITVRGITQNIGDSADDYHLIVGETASSIDFHGNLSSVNGTAKYRPAAVFTGTGDLFANDFNIFPCSPGEMLSIDLLYKGAPIFTGITKDDMGNDITVGENGKLSVLIDLDLLQSTIEVTVIPAEWGARIPIWTEK